jgi:hypothetical protein
VLRAERLENELGSLETERDVEVGRDELGHAADRSRMPRLDPAAAPKRVTTSVVTALSHKGRRHAVPIRALLPDEDVRNRYAIPRGRRGASLTTADRLGKRLGTTENSVAASDVREGNKER